jgi:hypothetical protein
MVGLATASVLASCALDERGLDPLDASHPRTSRDAGLALTDEAGSEAGGTGGAGGTSASDAAADGARALDAAADRGADAVAERPPVSPLGCADGTREGFVNVQGYPLIAACAGGWDVPGLLAPPTLEPQCGRRAGNSGPVPAGAGCSVADLCALGWHVCDTASDVFQLAGDCKDAIGLLGAPPIFFATRQRAVGPMCIATNDAGTSRLHGCGNFGNKENATCAPFTLLLRDMDCAATPPWSCPTTMMSPMTAAVGEYETVVKPGPAHGGVLCCHD